MRHGKLLPRTYVHVVCAGTLSFEGISGPSSELGVFYAFLDGFNRNGFIARV